MDATSVIIDKFDIEVFQWVMLSDTEFDEDLMKVLTDSDETEGERENGQLHR